MDAGTGRPDNGRGHVEPGPNALCATCQHPRWAHTNCYHCEALGHNESYCPCSGFISRPPHEEIRESWRWVAKPLRLLSCACMIGACWLDEIGHAGDPKTRRMGPLLEP